MPSSDERTNLKPADRRFLQRVAAHYTPQPLSAARRARFERALEERLADAARLPFLRPAGLLAATCAALLLWLALPAHQASDPRLDDRVPSVLAPLARDGATRVTSDGPDPTAHPTLLAYAYDQSEADIDVLPTEYVALAEAFDLL